jgi:hypothetical protein
MYNHSRVDECQLHGRTDGIPPQEAALAESWESGHQEQLDNAARAPSGKGQLSGCNRKIGHSGHW